MTTATPPQQSSPTPLRISKNDWSTVLAANGGLFADAYNEADARLIVKAANNHAALVEALQQCEAVLSATECTGVKQLANGRILDSTRELLTRIKSL